MSEKGQIIGKINHRGPIKNRADGKPELTKQGTVQHLCGHVRTYAIHALSCDARRLFQTIANGPCKNCAEPPARQLSAHGIRGLNGQVILGHGLEVGELVVIAQRWTGENEHLNATPVNLNAEQARELMTYLEAYIQEAAAAQPLTAAQKEQRRREIAADADRQINAGLEADRLAAQPGPEICEKCEYGPAQCLTCRK